MNGRLVSFAVLLACLGGLGLTYLLVEAQGRWDQATTDRLVAETAAEDVKQARVLKAELFHSAVRIRELEAQVARLRARQGFDQLVELCEAR